MALLCSLRTVSVAAASQVRFHSDRQEGLVRGLRTPHLGEACAAPATYISSESFLSSSSSSSSSSASSFLESSAFLESSSSFFFAFSTSLRSFHFFAKASASALSSVIMTLSKIVPPLPCHKSKPRKPKSSYLYTVSSSSYSGLAIFFASQTPL